VSLGGDAGNGFGGGDDDGDDDVARFTSIYRRNYPKVLAYALAHAQRSVAEDIANETFLTAWRKLDDMPSDDPLPWLFGVARRHRLKLHSSARRHESIADRVAQLGDEHDLRVRDTGDVVVERDAGLAAFACLSDQDAEILILTSWYGLSPAKAATVLGCSGATFYVRLHRARKRLARALKAQAGPVRPLETRRSNGEALEGQH
jgi:RNA polymerase sigma factor (sigma-70 family)